ncbi:hypothetical protein ACQKWADRAFT_297929 [Trichoderma austrokoningii]
MAQTHGYTCRDVAVLYVGWPASGGVWRLIQIPGKRRIIGIASYTSLLLWKSNARLLRNLEAHFIKMLKFAHGWTS